MWMRMGILATFIVAVTTGTALCADAAPGTSQGPAQASNQPPKHGPEFAGLELTPQQKEALKPILEARKTAVEKWQAENGDKVKAIREKIEAARAELKPFMESREKIHDDFLAQLKAVLTPEQFQKFMARAERRHERREDRRELFRELKLTDAQKAQIEAIRKDARAKAQAAATPEARKEIMKAAHEQIRTQVLTEEQRKEFREEMREEHPGKPGKGPRGMFAELNLTDAQKTQIEAIRKDARTKAQAATTPDAKKEIMKAAHEKIMNEVLTPEQREKIKEHRPGFGHGPQQPASAPAP